MYQPALLRCAAVCGIILLLTACTGESPRERQQRRLLARLDSSQQAMIAFTQQQTNFVYLAIEEKKHDPRSAEKLAIWKPRTDSIREASKQMCRYIQHQQKAFSAAPKVASGAARQAGIELYGKLYSFKKAVLNIDLMLYHEFEETILPQVNTRAPVDAVAAGFAQSYFAYLNAAEVVSQLNYWLQQLSIAEHRLVTYCNHQSTAMFCGYDVVQVLVGQNSSVLPPGGQLELLAGIGSFSASTSPKLFVKGIPVQKEDEPYFTYKMKVPSARGQYSLPLRMEYMGYDGTKKTQDITVTYSVR